jgi:hypothetical protein
MRSDDRYNADLIADALSYKKLLPSAIGGGATAGHVLTLDSNLAGVWQAAAGVGSEFTAKGDILVGTGSGTYDNLAAGSNGSILAANSSETTGLQWVSSITDSVSNLIESETEDLSTQLQNILLPKSKVLTDIDENVETYNRKEIDRRITSGLEDLSDEMMNILGDFLFRRSKGGSFTQAAATSKVVTGVGFKPKLLLTITQQAASTTIASMGVGYASQSGSALVTFRTASAAWDRRASTTYCCGENGGGSLVGTATLTSFDADGFTLNFDNATSVTVYWVAIG